MPESWESKVNAIMESRDLETMTMNEIMENLKTYEMKKIHNQKDASPRREVKLVLKATQNQNLVKN